jgi:hypothetical protein
MPPPALGMRWRRYLLLGDLGGAGVQLVMTVLTTCQAYGRAAPWLAAGRERAVVEGVQHHTNRDR